MTPAAGREQERPAIDSATLPPMQLTTPPLPREAAEGREPLPFPLRVAAIDVGSNAFRFVAAEFSDPGRYVELASERVPVRLGRSAFLTGELSPSAIDRTVEGFRRFREEIDRLGHQRGSGEPQRRGSRPPRQGGRGNSARSHLRDG